MTFQQTGVAPAYWAETGSFFSYEQSVTGGSTIGTLEFGPGRHALVCSTENNDLYLLTDLVVSP